MSEPFEKGTFVKGKMKAKLRVKSDCEDTCFYVRISLVKKEGDFGLRDDITQISNKDKNYIPHSEITLDFLFDEHAFLIQKGEKLIFHHQYFLTLYLIKNKKGLMCVQKTAETAHNTVIGSKSFVTIYCE